jgi:hypothetical protein
MNSSSIGSYALGINILQNKHIIFDVAAATILIRDNFDCSLLRKPIEPKPFLQYYIFVTIFAILFGRQFVIKIIRRYRVDGSKNELKEEK